LDRLSSELHCVIKIAGRLNDNDVVIRTIEQNLDTKSPEGKLMLYMLIALGKHWPGLPNCAA
jgi:DNA invertase Pin-like site-specific DNA recombinase